jgi:hypothetical protein
VSQASAGSNREILAACRCGWQLQPELLGRLLVQDKLKLALLPGSYMA